jgi:hypothetical protein
MKYLYIIASIVTLASILFLFSLLPEKETPQNEIALTVNGHDIGKSTVQQESTRYGYHTEEQSDIYDTIITKELLIQEAQKQQIDKEPNFRKALKDYYETSLIKILFERKNKELVIDVKEAEIKNYITYLGKTITFTRLDSIPETATSASSSKGLTTTALFDDLADPIKMLLSSLSPGQFGTRFDTGSEKFALRLDRVEETKKSAPVKADRKKIIESLSEFKREQQINNWLAELRLKATITIHNKK